MRAEQALRASEDRYRSLVELAGSVIVVVDADGRITEFNREAETFFGVSRADALDRSYVDCCVSEPHRAAVSADLARIRAGDSLQGRESAFVQRDGTHKSFLWNATRLTDSGGESPQLLVIGQDISELRRLEHQLLLAQRMEGIGRLAGGIAHDFNNLLTAILGHAEMAQDDVAPTDPARGNIAEITRAAQRAADLTRQLLAFARRQIIEPRIVDLNGLVLNVDRMLRRLLGEDVELVTVQDPDLWRVRIDPGQFEQVLVNLAVNARDAMPTGGTLVIETRNVHLDDEFARQHTTVQPGRARAAGRVRHRRRHGRRGAGAHLRAVLHDQGRRQGHRPGPGDLLRHRQAEPRQHLGRFRAGHGHDVPHLPAACRGRHCPTIEPSEPRVAEQPRGSETVLLVEDEVLVRNLAADALAPPRLPGAVGLDGRGSARPGGPGAASDRRAGDRRRDAPDGRRAAGRADAVGTADPEGAVHLRVHRPGCASARHAGAGYRLACRSRSPPVSSSTACASSSTPIRVPTRRACR